jgi:hypothetical protein
VVPEGVDEGLWVLEAKADGEGLGLEGEVDGVEVSVDVTGGVTGGEDDGSQKLLVGVGADADDGVVANDECVHACGEEDGAAAGEDKIANTLDDEGKSVRADVGVCVDEDVGGGTEVAEGAEDIFDRAAFVRAGVELAVGEGTGTTFAKGVVGFGL